MSFRPVPIPLSSLVLFVYLDQPHWPPFLFPFPFSLLFCKANKASPRPPCRIVQFTPSTQKEKKNQEITLGNKVITPVSRITMCVCACRWAPTPQPVPIYCPGRLSKSKGSHTVVVSVVQLATGTRASLRRNAVSLTPICHIFTPPRPPPKAKSASTAALASGSVLPRSLTSLTVSPARRRCR